MEFKKLVVVVREPEDTDWTRYYGLLTSYSIMNAQVIRLKEDDLFPVLAPILTIKTIVHIDTAENIQSALSMYQDTPIRYIGYVNVTNGIVTNNCMAYVGIPVSINYLEEVKTTMKKKEYPCIQLTPLRYAHELYSYYNIMGKSVEFKLYEKLVQTSSTLEHTVFIQEEQYSVVRYVGKPSVIQKTNKSCLNLIGYPVIM